MKASFKVNLGFFFFCSQIFIMNLLRDLNVYYFLTGNSVVLQLSHFLPMRENMVVNLLCILFG